MVKTRTLAKKLVQAGKIRLNNTKTTSPSLDVGPADVLTITLERRILVYQIEATGDRRGPASVAATLYQDLSPPVVRSNSPDRPVIHGKRLEGSGRPTKRERRKLSEFRTNIGEEF